MNEGTPIWGDGLKALRTIHQLTQDALAERSKVSQSVISRLENGSFEASDVTRIRLARVFGVDPHALFPYLDHSERAS